MTKWKLGLNSTVLNQVVLNWYKMTLLNSPYTVLCAITKLEYHIIMKPVTYMAFTYLTQNRTQEIEHRENDTIPWLRPHEAGPCWCYRIRPMKRLLEESTQVWPLCMLLTLCSPDITTVLLSILVGTYMPGSLSTHLVIY